MRQVNPVREGDTFTSSTPTKNLAGAAAGDISTTTITSCVFLAPFTRPLVVASMEMGAKLVWMELD